jgi:hypothetical protein
LLLGLLGDGDDGDGADGVGDGEAGFAGEFASVAVLECGAGFDGEVVGAFNEVIDNVADPVVCGLAFDGLLVDLTTLD